MGITNESYISEETRNEAYKAILDKATGQAKRVLECIVNNYPITDKRISEITGIPQHIVVARRNELWGKEKNPYTGLYEINPEKQLIILAGVDKKVKPKQCLWMPLKVSEDFIELEINFI